MWFYFIRHGMPDYANDCLTEYGRQQAAAVADRFAESGLDKIFASSMGRAKETAEFTAKKLGLNVELLDFAREDKAAGEFAVFRDGRNKWCFFDRQTLDEFLSEEVISLGDKWYDSPKYKDTNYKSGTLRVKKATAEFIEKLGYRFNEKRGTYTAVKHVYDKVALFAHGGFSMIFLSCLLNIPYPAFCTRFQHIGTSTVCAFHLDDEGENILPVIYQYGSDAHLYKESLLDGLDVKAF